MFKGSLGDTADVAGARAPGAGPTPLALALERSESAFLALVDEAAAIQREIDALFARRARRLVDALAAAASVEVVAGRPTAMTAEFAHRSTRAELALALGVSERTAERWLSEALLLRRDLPGVLEAVESGGIAWRAASLIAECAAALVVDRAAGGEDRLAEFAAAAIEVARRAQPSRLRGRLHVLLERCRTRPPAERHLEARAERRVELEDVEDGMSWLRALLPSVEAHAVVHRLTDVARAARDLDAEEGIADDRTLEQRRADLLVDFLVGDHVRIGSHERRIAQGRDLGRFAGIRPTVVVTVPVQQLLGIDPDAGGAGAIPAMLDGVVPIDPATARALTANAPSLYRLLVDPHTGASLDLSRTRYTPSTQLRMWLRLRDATCRFPGCGRLAQGCDLDHTVAWQHGGATSASNLAHLCRSHHVLKHQTRWRMAQHADGTITWRSPSGREYVTSPPRPALAPPG